MSQGDETCLSDTPRPIRGIFLFNEQRTLVAESEQVKVSKSNRGVYYKNIFPLQFFLSTELQKLI